MGESERAPQAQRRVRFPTGENELAARLREIISDEPQTSFARRAGVAESVLRKYLNGAMPSADRLVRLADAAGVSIEWLAAGRGQKGRQGSPARLDDLERLRSTVAAVQQGLEATGRTLPPAKYAELVVAAYELMAAPGATSARVVQFIKAAA